MTNPSSRKRKRAPTPTASSPVVHPASNPVVVHPASASAPALDVKSIKETQHLSDAACVDIERYSSVALATCVARDSTIAVYIMMGVFYDKLVELTEGEIKQVGLDHFYKHDHDFLFCLSALDEFNRDILVGKNGYIYWNRTGKYYRVPLWYRNQIPRAIEEIRAAQCTFTKSNQ